MLKLKSCFTPTIHIVIVGFPSREKENTATNTAVETIHIETEQRPLFSASEKKFCQMLSIFITLHRTYFPLEVRWLISDMFKTDVTLLC